MTDMFIQNNLQMIQDIIHIYSWAYELKQNTMLKHI